MFEAGRDVTQKTLSCNFSDMWFNKVLTPGSKIQMHATPFCFYFKNFN